MITFDATSLREALGNVEPHAEHKGTLAALGAVRFECDGDTLTVVTTDRYVLATDTVKAAEPGQPFAMLLALDDIARLSALLKGAPRNVTVWPVTFALDGDTLTVTVPGFSATFRTVPAEFPRWRSIFDVAQEATTDDERTVAHAAYDPKLLAKFAKVTEHGRKANVMRMHFSEPVKPALIEVGETFRAVIMPCRVEWPARVSV